MGGLRIGLVFELRGSAPSAAGHPPDGDAEYEPEETIALLEEALRRLGHRPLRLGTPRELWSAAGGGSLPELDAALNVAEGHGSRNREAWAPVLLEMLQIPTLGSDALTLSLSLDKAWCKDVVAAAGVPVAPHLSVESPWELQTANLLGSYPFFVKPRWEGTAKGIGPGSRADDPQALQAAVARVCSAYGQPALVEPFLPGAEYTVTLVGSEPVRALPALQRALERRRGIGLHALEGYGKEAPPVGFQGHLPGSLEPALEKQLEDIALRAFRALRCRDFGRVDLRLDADGRPQFLEINPLPTFGREGSFAILAELMDRSLEDLLAEIFQAALERLGLT